MTSRFNAYRIVRSRTDQGFTLIELIAVLAIMATMLALVVGRGSPVSPASQARAAARDLSGGLRSARSEAIMTNRSISFSVDSVLNRYWWGRRQPQLLPRTLSLALSTESDLLANDHEGSIRFDPDGGSTGGRIAVAGGDRTWWVGVDWLSGG